MSTQLELGNSSVQRRLSDVVAFRRISPHLLAAIGLPLATLILLVWYWDWAVTAYEIPTTLLPRPYDAFQSLSQGIADGSLVFHTWVTLQEVVYGFVIGAAGGLLLGILIAESNYVRMALFPFLIAFQMVPKVAVAPLFIIWLGYGITSKIAIAASITFFPVVINTIAGLRSVDVATIEMLRAYRASRWQVFHRAKLRYALPYIFASLEVAIVLAVIGAIVAEFVGSSSGLGYLILQATHTLETGEIFAVLVMLSILGVLLNGLVRFFAKRALFWHESERSTSR
ncbi:MAG: ABC transporter permease [Rhizobiaceae bacterium]|nr:ABC transporter permease [Rhizobiaceae bacterium]